MSAPPQGPFRLGAGSFLGSLRVVRPLRTDNDGELYLARDSARQAAVLLRVFPEPVAAGEARRAALAERCAAAAALQHPGLARCAPLQSDRGLWFTAFEVPEGPRGEPMTLADALAEAGGRLPEDRVLRLAEHLCQALGFAHRFRGQGLPHGRLSLETIFLTAQRQPRVADLRLAGPCVPADDVRAMGVILCRLLAGTTPDPSASPCAPSLSRRWDRLIRRCLRAGEPDGFAGIGELAEALAEGGEGTSAGRARTVAAVVVAGAVAAAGTVLVWQRFLAPPRPDAAGRQNAVRAAPSVPGPADWQQRVDACLAAGDTAGAEAILRERVAAEPGDAEAGRRLAALESRREAQTVGPIKEAAERLFARAMAIPQTEGIEARLEGLRTLRQQAAGHLAALRFEKAADAYRRLNAEAEAVLRLAESRREAARMRTRAEEARETARDAGARTDAAEVWNAAETAWAQGAALYSEARFEEAAAAFRQAASDFERAAGAAGGARSAATARERFERQKGRAGEDLLRRLPAGVSGQIAGLARDAAAAEAAGQPAEAAVLWTRAETLLRESLDAAAAATRPPPVPGDRFHRPAGGNLVTNGDLEEGADGQPRGWSRMDRLTTFWEPGGNPGRCLRFDTSVQQADKRRLQADPSATPVRTQGGQYDTVGAHEGVWAFPAPIPVLPTDRYFLLEVDCMGPARSSALSYPQVLVRGFRLFDPERDAGTVSWFQTPHEGGPAFSEQFGKAQRRAQPGDYLMIWRHSLVCRNSGPNLWEHFRMGIELPADPRFRPEVILLRVYAMWPLGEYRFDNLSLRAATREEYEKAKAEGHSIEGFMPMENGTAPRQRP